MIPHHSLRHLDAYLEGVLSRPAGRRLAAHLSRCPDCARTARERARVLDAARSVDARPAAVTHPVLPVRGVSGRLVVLALAMVVLLGGLLAAVWVAGAPRGVARAQAGPTDALGVVQRQSAAASSPGATVEELRGLGWTVPSLTGAGLQPLEVRGEQAADLLEVAVVWGRAEPAVTVHECRSRTATAVPRGCASGREDAAMPGRRLPGGVAYRLTDDPSGEGWIADLATAQAAYRVESTLPREQAEPLLTLLVVSDRSGLTELRRDDAVTDRLERGLERIVEAVPSMGRVAGILAVGRR
ncbi:zf-HC2 domain-containing protein [Micrococcaceae bacterium Sec6.3]